MNALETVKEARLPTVSEMKSAMDQHRYLLQRWADTRAFEVNSGMPLLPPAELERVEREIAAFRDDKCRHDRAVVIVTKLMMSFPQAAMEDPGHARAYMTSAAEALAAYPEPVARQAAEEVLHQSRFRPSVAELVEVADRVLWQALDGADAGASKMRAEAVRRASEAAERRRRDEEYELRSGETEAAVIAALHGAGVKPGDIKHASRVLDYRRLNELVTAAKAGESWAAIPLRAAALLARIHIAVQDHRADYRCAVRVAEALEARRIALAEKIVAAAEKAPADPDAWRSATGGRDPRTCGVPWQDLRTAAAASLQLTADQVDQQQSVDHAQAAAA